MKISSFLNFIRHLKELSLVETEATLTDRFVRFNISGVDYFFAYKGEKITDYDGWGTTDVKSAENYLKNEHEDGNKDGE